MENGNEKEAAVEFEFGMGVRDDPADVDPGPAERPSDLHRWRRLDTGIANLGGSIGRCGTAIERVDAVLQSLVAGLKEMGPVIAGMKKDALNPVPGSDSFPGLVAAARNVVAARYGSPSPTWDELKNAIAELADALEENHR